MKSDRSTLGVGCCYLRWSAAKITVWIYSKNRTQCQGEVEGSGGAGDGALGATGGASAGFDQLAAGAGLPSGGGVGRSAPGWCCPGAGEGQRTGGGRSDSWRGQGGEKRLYAVV
jgi:hypothetical protein